VAQNHESLGWAVPDIGVLRFRSQIQSVDCVLWAVVSGFPVWPEIGQGDAQSLISNRIGGDREWDAVGVSSGNARVTSDVTGVSHVDLGRESSARLWHGAS
jgi:hypothetical protein